uniref:PAS domain-containing protein n=1 Tax=Plectus sambesii TaxID=2011161 RepID=A0A914W4E9_9BILA
MPVRKGSLAGIFGNVILDACVKQHQDQNILLATRQATGGTVILCSDGFERLFGFRRSEIIQRSCLCQWMHGPLTAAADIEQLNKAVIEGTEVPIAITLYSKHGEPIDSLVQAMHLTGRLNHGPMVLLSFAKQSSNSQPSLTLEDPTDNEASPSFESANKSRILSTFGRQASSFSFGSKRRSTRGKVKNTTTRTQSTSAACIPSEDVRHQKAERHEKVLPEIRTGMCRQGVRASRVGDIQPLITRGLASLAIDRTFLWALQLGMRATDNQI